MENNNSKVSIIIAIYKVSMYLRQCLDSIVNQTYRNLEIICVVGKTDTESMDIVEEYSKKDNRIVFIPVEPKGVAAARNAGLRQVSGEYIAFIDGDDYVDLDMIQTMVDSIEEEGADISIVGKYYLYENLVEGNNGNSRFIYDRQGVMKEIIKNEKFFLHLWDKLYKKEFFDGVTFNESAIVEDRQLCFDILNKADKVVFSEKSKYYFRQCLDSSSKVYKNKEDSLKEDYIICEKLKMQFPELEDDIKLFLVIENMSLIQNSFLFDVFSREHDRKYINFVKKNLGSISNCSKGLMIKMILCSYFPRLFGRITVKRRNEFLDSHIHFKSGNDWEKLFKEQGLEV